MPKHHTIYPTTKQNGFVERMNMMLMDKERNMLSGVSLAQEFWTTGVDTAKYLLNRSPSSTLVDSNPHEAWFGKKSSLSHIKLFGCDALVHVPREKRGKLDKKTIKCILLGYKDGMK
jgi:hypothetical protein